MKYLRTYNESIRDKMTPKSKEDIKKFFTERGYSFGDSLSRATFSGLGEDVDEILCMMDEVYRETDSDEIKKDIEGAYSDGLDIAIEDGSYEVIETYVSYKIKGLTKKHFHKAFQWGFEDKYGFGEPTLGMAELLYRDERMNGELTDKQKTWYEEMFTKYNSLNESIKDMMTPKSEEELVNALKTQNPYERMYFGAHYGILSLVKSVLDNNHYMPTIIDELLKIARKNNHKDIVEYIQQYIRTNESVRDLMTPRTKESMIEYLKGLSQYEKSQKLLKLDLQKPDDIDMLKNLVEAGASVNYKNRDGITMLDMACAHGKLELVKYLIDNGADVNSLDYEDRTAMMAATCNGFPDIIELLVQNGADINAQNDDERTALHDAVTNRRVECVKKLLELGADVTITDDVENTPLDLIVGAWKSESSVKIIDMLREKEKEHNRPINRIKRFLKFNESVRDFLKPKPKEEIKEILDRLPERERLIKGIKMEVYDDKDIDEMLGGLSPREYFIRSIMVEKGLPVDKRRLVDKAMSLIKPYKKVRIGDLLTVPPMDSFLRVEGYTSQPLYQIVQKITFFNRDEFNKFIKEYQETTSHDVMSDSFIKHLYQENSWKKVNCVIVLAKNRNKYGSLERKKNTYIIYDYGKTTGVFKYTKEELDEYEKGS